MMFNRSGILFYRQVDKMDCGPVCLRIILKHYGKSYELDVLKRLFDIDHEGVSFQELQIASQQLGFNSNALRFDIEEASDYILPCILHWESNHFVVLYKIQKDRFYIADPDKGRCIYDKKEFIKKCGLSDLDSAKNKAFGLFLSPRADFESIAIEKSTSDSKKITFRYLLEQISRYKLLIINLILGLAFANLIQFAFPLILQYLIDTTIKNPDFKVINLLLFSQLFLVIGRTVLDFSRTWIMMFFSSSLYFKIVSDFYKKLSQLPIAFFDRKLTGDLMQRVNDHRRLQSFITNNTINFVVSLSTVVVLSFLISFYNIKIFIITLVSTILYSVWILYFQNKRKFLDYEQFRCQAKEQSMFVQYMSGMQDLKLNSAQDISQKNWSLVQKDIYTNNTKILKVSQVQQSGALFINEIKNVIILYITVNLVVDGSITIGGMLAISTIIGQVQSPISQLVQFFQSYFDAKISLDRINSIHQLDEEKSGTQSPHTLFDVDENGSIKFENVSFSYKRNGKQTLNNINLEIPLGKITAIVGESGSGKTTLIKLLLKYYQVSAGTIKIGENNLESISTEKWRNGCASVLQDSYIFSDTISFNITMKYKEIDFDRFWKSINLVNMLQFIDELPNGVNTVIGNEGLGLSQGQKQRILIARAIYKNPELLFFDEATNSLDSNNESEIVKNIENMFQRKTLIIAAHRLSTIINADNIIVLENGIVVEVGNHDTLMKNNSIYANLIRKQMTYDTSECR